MINDKDSGFKMKGGEIFGGKVWLEREIAVILQVERQKSYVTEIIWV